MGLTAIPSGMPGAEPFPGLSDAWHWSPNPRFHFVAALATDREHVLQINTMDSYDETLVREVLAFARDHFAQLANDERPLIALPGFTAIGRDFDTVAAAAPRAHTYHARDDKDLHQATYAVFPGWHYEFSGTETDEEAHSQVSHPHGLRVTNLNRETLPFLKMSYRNTTTGSRSTAAHRTLAKPPVLMRELELLKGAAASFVEFENFRHHVWRAEWAGTYVLEGEGTRRELDRAELLAFAQAALTEV
ncbi:hypothetical protein [Streptomyces sp. NPDC003710]